MLGLRVLLLDGAKGGGRGEHGGHLVLGDHAPEGTGVGRAHGLALVDDGGAPMQERAIDDVRVAHHPAHVRGGPVHLAGLHPVDVLHAPLQSHRVTAVVAHHPLGFPGGSRCVEDVERIRGGDADAVPGFGVPECVLPLDIAPEGHLAGSLRSLQDDAMIGLVTRLVDGLVQKGLVLHYPGGFDAAGSGHHDLRFGVVDARGQFMGREAAEDHRMHGADTGAPEHGHERFRHHRHVDDDAVPFCDAQAGQRPREQGDPVAHLPVGEGLLCVGDRAVVDHCGLVAAAFVDVAVECVVAGVQPAPGEPAMRRRPGLVEHLFPGGIPVDGPGGLGPEPFGIAHRAGIDVFIPHDSLLCDSCRCVACQCRSWNAPWSDTQVSGWRSSSVCTGFDGTRAAARSGHGSPPTGAHGTQAI
jgi:hypothetical protein